MLDVETPLPVTHSQSAEAKELQTRNRSQGLTAPLSEDGEDENSSADGPQPIGNQSDRLERPEGQESPATNSHRLMSAASEQNLGAHSHPIGAL